MAEGMGEEQLVSFCHQLGLAKDGYLSEGDLAIVCRCIGLVAPEEMMKQLFEELDGDHDGRVCLAELSLMLHGMQLQQPQKPSFNSDKSTCDDATEPPPMLGGDMDRFTFSIFDPNHTGTAKVSVILDLWSQLGISPSVGQQVLKELGFSVQSKLSTISLQHLGRSIDEETEHSKEGDLPAVFLAALLTYRTEAQFLRTLCENVECERDKLKLDVAEAHERSTMLAQEVDEQNARLERNSQVQLLKMESKYAEQIQTLQQSMSQEKETLLQTIQQLEKQLTELQGAEDKLKTSIAKLKGENIQLESEVRNLTQEVQNVTWVKTKLQDELVRYVEMEKEMQEMVKQNAAMMSQSEEKLRRRSEEIQGLKDQNDELSSQLERMKDALDGMKSLDGARFNSRRRRKKAPTPKQELTKMDDDQSCVPLHKMGKFHQEIANGVEHDVDDAESSLEHAFLSCSSQDIDSGTFQNLERMVAMNLEGGVVDESCTEAMQEEGQNDGAKDELAEESTISLLEEYRRLQASMSAVKEKLSHFPSETDLEAVSQSVEQLDRVRELEEALESARTGFEAESGMLRAQCGELERSLELLQAEYEKCEEYWHGKLQEERVEYEHDRNVNDEKFHELAEKIQEYEEMCLQQNELSSKLPPIEERASLEKQVTDLDDECQCLREQLQSLQSEQQSAVSKYQRQAELKVREECGHLEEQVKVLQQKCQEYELRLTSLTEEGKEDEMKSPSTLRARVQALEDELQAQTERHAEHVQNLERTWKRKNVQKSSHSDKRAPAALQPLHQNFCGNGEEGVEMLVAPPLGPFWAQSQDHRPFYHYATDQASSLPYVPSSYGHPVVAGQNGFGFDAWSFPAGPQQSGHQQPKKTWCHVEVAWLQALRAKLKQREDQCLMLQRALCSLEQQHEKILTEMKFQHKAEISNWEDLMKGSQELVRQQTIKQKEQTDKLAQAEAVMKDLWADYSRAQQRVSYLESLLGGAPSTHK